MKSTPQIRPQRFLADPHLPPHGGRLLVDALGKLRRGALAAPADAQLPQVIGAPTEPTGQLQAPGHV